MTIYIDTDFRCHLADDGTMRAVETDYFNGKCAEFIEGYRYVPEGATWTRRDGEVFSGEMIAPAVDYLALAEAQRRYEHDVLPFSNKIAAVEDALCEQDAAGEAWRAAIEDALCELDRE